jgi:hypothetical protein
MMETRLPGASCCFSGIVPSHPTRANGKEMGRRVPGMHFSELVCRRCWRPGSVGQGNLPPLFALLLLILGLSDGDVGDRSESFANSFSRFLLAETFLVDIGQPVCVFARKVVVLGCDG